MIVASSLPHAQLGRTSAMRISTLQRFAAYACLGCLLLLIYQIVFMTRTSVSRDWNHVHSKKFTLSEVQRLAIKNVRSTEQLNKALDKHSMPNYFKKSSLNHHRKTKGLGIESIYCDGKNCHETVFPMVSNFRVFGLQPLNKHRVQILKPKQIELISYSPHRSVSEEVQHTIKSGKSALFYVVPPNWEPNFGFQAFDIPVLAVYDVPSPHIQLELKYNELESLNPDILEWRLDGYTRETIVVGDSHSSPESHAIFLEIARVFKTLSTLGWRPIRSIRFISYPYYLTGHIVESQSKSRNRDWIAFIDCAQHIEHNITYASPTLKEVTNWAVTQLVDAGLVLEVDTTDIFQAPYGSNAFLFDLQIPSVSASLDSPENHARFITLLLVNLVDSPLLPFRANGYKPFLESSYYDVKALEFDSKVDIINENFTREYPWYQPMDKYWAIVQKKRANWILARLEGLFSNEESRHSLFSTDKSGTRTVINKSPRSINLITEKVIKELSSL